MSNYSLIKKQRKLVNIEARLQAKKPVYVNNFNAYFLWFIIIPFLLLATLRPRKYLKLPRSLILTILFNASLTRLISPFTVKIISSTYTNNVVKDPSEKSNNKEWLFTHWKKDDNLANHSLLACLRPYKVFFNLQTYLGWIEVNKGGVTMYTSSFNSSS